ncbi:hypothetical protein CTI12_AA186700 [Artemisia annua]|uniref:Uncharacterized protein n=1 Tax=Artemisia annua TaxID=35608 RepID=A0A2U1P762_ARTAN|nr:hypothetical protein CTI12_AA186700 [Artemisia annua]
MRELHLHMVGVGGFSGVGGYAVYVYQAEKKVVKITREDYIKCNAPSPVPLKDEPLLTQIMVIMALFGCFMLAQLLIDASEKIR